jgi:hypothetical protein
VDTQSSFFLHGEDQFGLFTKDATYLYLLTLLSLYEKNISLTDGRVLFNESENRGFDGLYWLLDIMKLICNFDRGWWTCTAVRASG